MDNELNWRSLAEHLKRAAHAYKKSTHTADVDIAAEMGVDRSSLNHWLNARRTPKITEFLDLCNVLRVDPIGLLAASGPSQQGIATSRSTRKEGQFPHGRFMQDEAASLATLFKGVRNRAEFARVHQVPGGPTMVYQHLKGLKPISLEAAVAYARAFNVSLHCISERFAKMIDELPTTPARATTVTSSVGRLRAENLRWLVNEAGGPAAFARRHHGIDATYVRQLLNGHRGFGEKAARNMEIKIGLAEGALDADPSATDEGAKLACVTQAIGSWPFRLQKSRYDALSRADKIRIEGILEGAVSAIESERAG